MKYTVKVKCGSSQTFVKKIDDGTLEVAIRERPIQGAANKAVVLALAEYFGVSRSCVSLLAGHASRSKIIEIK